MPSGLRCEQTRPAARDHDGPRVGSLEGNAMGWELLVLAWVAGLVFALVKFYGAISAIVDHRNGAEKAAPGDDD